MARLVSIHAPWEGCDTSALAVVHAIDVSIHAPWEGCDACSPRRFLRQIKFQFTHPGKGATVRTHIKVTIPRSFNSRTLGRVRLPVSEVRICTLPSFNSRTLGRVRLSGDACRRRYDDKFQFTHPGKGATAVVPTIPASGNEFQFTHPGKGATQGVSDGARNGAVSIHAPWEGCDAQTSSYGSRKRRFNSRTLGRVRQCGAKLRIIGRINKRNLRLGVLS